MKKYVILFKEWDHYSGPTFSVKRTGSYQEVEKWAYEQKIKNAWKCFGIKEAGDIGWAVPEETA